MDAVNEKLNAVIETLLQNPAYVPLMMQARDDSPRFCLWPMYTDIVSFFKLVESNVVDNYVVQEHDALLTTLHNFYRTADRAVVERCGGCTTDGKAHGMSIYLPKALIDDSYINLPVCPKLPMDQSFGGTMLLK